MVPRVLRPWQPTLAGLMLRSCGASASAGRGGTSRRGAPSGATFATRPGPVRVPGSDLERAVDLPRRALQATQIREVREPERCCTTSDQDAELLRGKNAVAVVSFHDTYIFPTDAEPGSRAQRVIAPDPHGRFHKVHHKASNPTGTYEADSPAYWEEISEELAPAGAILVLGHGNGKANASHHWVAYIERHHHDLAAKLVADVRVDIDHIDEEQVLRLAQAYCDEVQRRDTGDSRRGVPAG